MSPSRRAPDTGAYVLHLRLARRVAALRLGRRRLALAAGDYLYFGSARAGIAARVRLHREVARTRRARGRWHLHRLLARPGVTVVRAVSVPGGDECALCQGRQRRGGVVSVPGFGATDCRAACGTHLLRVSRARLCLPGGRLS